MKKAFLFFCFTFIVMLNSCTYEKADTSPLIPDDTSVTIISYNTDINPSSPAASAAALKAVM